MEAFSRLFFFISSARDVILCHLNVYGMWKFNVYAVNMEFVDPTSSSSKYSGSFSAWRKTRLLPALWLLRGSTVVSGFIRCFGVVLCFFVAPWLCSQLKTPEHRLQPCVECITSSAASTILGRFRPAHQIFRSSCPLPRVECRLQAFKYIQIFLSLTSRWVQIAGIQVSREVAVVLLC
jgi:hypothetical protein